MNVISVLCDSHHKNYNIYLFILPLTHLYKHLTLGLGCLYKHTDTIISRIALTSML